MKLKILFYFIFSVSLLYGASQQKFIKNDIEFKILSSKFYKVNKDNKVILVDNKKHNFYKDIITQVKSIYNKPYLGENGKAIVEIIINPAIGKISNYLLYANTGNKVFRKHINKFLSNILKKKILFSLNDHLYRFKILIAIKSSRNIESLSSFLLLGEKHYIKDPYKKYLTYLILYKHLTKKQIKKILAADEVTIKKAMLYYLYYRYTNPNGKYADFYYKKLIANKEFLKSKIEAVFIADTLLENKDFFEINYLLPDNFCSIIPDRELKESCYYYQGVAKYINNFDDFLNPLQKALDIPEARLFYQRIGF